MAYCCGWVFVFGVARVLAMEVLHEAMVIVDDWMQWLMSRRQRRRWSEVRLRRRRAVVKATLKLCSRDR